MKTRDREASTASLQRSDRGGLRVLAFWPGGSTSLDLDEHAAAIVVGRGRDCQLAIEHESVSRRHASIRTRPLTVEDLESANGTRVRGERIASKRRHPIACGELFEIGAAAVVIQDLAHASPAAPVRADADAIARVAPTTVPVLILGETGVGKEVMADRIHRLSARANRPFVKLNCAALPEPLLEGELFGYERGAFTGALAPKAGLLESADGGTLLLDEVGDLQLATQAKLLRVLENGEVTRLGALAPRRIDVRLISATHRDLPAMVAAKQFREDLYYRIRGLVVVIPPLRERVAEIAPLARELIAAACAKQGRRTLAIPPAAIALLEAWPWSGNVRELLHALELAVALSPGDTLDPAHLPQAPRAEPAPRPAPAGDPDKLRAAASVLERQRIIDALAAANGNQSRAAKSLGMSRNALLRRLDQYGLPRPRRS